MEVNNKARLLKLKEILDQETDEEHELSLKELEQRLKTEFGPDFEVGRKALRADLETLKDHGFDLIENDGKQGKKLYSYQNRLFELHELRMLIDAVVSARFISREDSKRLIDKLKTQTSRHQAKRLQNQIYLDDTIRSESRHLRYALDKIHNAIFERKILRFKYGRYNVEKKIEWGRNGTFYEVEPYFLVWKQDYYYLVGKFVPDGRIKHYRVDRMDEVDLTEKSFKMPDVNAAEYINKVFHMFSGEEMQVKIRFNNKLINVIIDRFGKDVSLTLPDKETFIIHATATVSEGLVNWIMTWGGDAEVLSPPELVERVKEKAAQVYALYHQKDPVGAGG
ncbi:helix-turn-helix transcriptional regulator [Kroppenstedtia eburnea]|uniref:Predicted DNA-binding transcriptional regulator YafY, contains an HTH and WYL domains n=1 Tax=Kroppenstedtia eburnea TaxID=714067 RepID=A0A1N7J5I1_9BACL|nr:WYL domain-containing protein [Kroppenstedtia eburnea]QKI82532.1 WYL domain-containing protein [Kroppenstedtia eburnea]SIS44615.1 Predicted DNA-binding transcriptional regulator YafY, contains an HTH and WYL domains [Kroppenstedtia eburnea]